MSTGNDQFGNFSGGQAPPKSNVGKILLIVFGVLLVLGLLCCGGLFFSGMWAVNAGASQMAEIYRSNPDFVAEIGELKSSKFNFQATGTEAPKHPGKQAVVLDVVGSKGSGQLILIVTPGNANDVQSGILRMADGREVPLGKTSVDVEMPEMEMSNP